METATGSGLNKGKIAKSRGHLWLDTELELLLDIWGSEKIISGLDGTSRNAYVYEKISERMRDFGHNRTAKEVRNKVKNLKRDYKLAINHSEHSGVEPKGVLFKDKLGRILRRLQSNVNEVELVVQSSEGIKEEEENEAEELGDDTTIVINVTEPAENTVVKLDITADLYSQQLDMALVDLARRLLNAAKQGNDSEVTSLLTNGAPFTSDWLGTSPLHLACRNGHQSTAEVLLRSGVSRDARTKVDQTPLHVSAMKGHKDVVEMLLRHKANINATDMLLMTPLHWAVERGQTDVVKCLLKYEADIECKNKFEKTPLNIAQDRGHQDIAQLIREKQEQRFEPENPLPRTPVLIRTSGSTSDASGISLSTIRPVETITVNKDIFTESSGSSTSVLATLAALAEASTPLKHPSGTEMPWLDGRIPRGTQTFILTDAGKLALGKSCEALGSRLAGKSSLELAKHDRNDDGSETEESENPAKKQRTNDVVSLREGSDPGDLNLFEYPPLEPETLTIVCGENGEMIIQREGDRDSLEQQLERAQQEAEEARQELARKVKEASDYRSKLEEMNGDAKAKPPRKQSLETRDLGNS